jgi:hypothetical protein
MNGGYGSEIFEEAVKQITANTVNELATRQVVCKACPVYAGFQGNLRLRILLKCGAILPSPGEKLVSHRQKVSFTS